ncbi:MAG: DUF2127 domain-containing protein [Actinomycetota bacterium]|nr:DUF2127 domain-containing protein [Actinomycetota bacterium]
MTGPKAAPGTVHPDRFLPRLHYELLACGVRGHELIGTDAAEVRPQDAVVVREAGNVRWHRCVRCDSWLPLPRPAHPSRRFPPDRDEVELPLRGKALRDKIVLRLIAIDRALHFVLLGLLAAAIFLFTAHEASLKRTFYRVLTDLQGGVGGGPVQTSHTGVLHDLDRLFTLKSSTLHVLGAAVAAYALLEGLEAIGLWYQKRWAEYLTFVATTAFLPLEVIELTKTVSPFKVTALVINLAVVVYLLFAKRLFGLRGGAAADEAERARDVGWEALERTAPEHGGAPAAG